MRIEPVFAAGTFSGSAFQVSRESFLTCRHVTHKLLTTGDWVAKRELEVGAAKLAVEKAIPSSTEDLALLVLKQPQPPVPILFSRQWEIGEVVAYGFEDPPAAQCGQDGPFTLPRRHVSRNTDTTVSFARGLPEGFSGGPIVGTFDGVDYCVGVAFMGRTGYASSVLLLAAPCVDFLHQHLPNPFALVDLDMEALRIFLEQQEADAICRRGRIPEFAILCSSRSSSYVSDASARCRAINRDAIQRIRDRRSLAGVALELDGLELAEYLEKHPGGRRVAETLTDFATRKKGVKLSRPDALRALLLSGGSSVAIHGYSEDYLGDYFPYLERFRRLLQTQL